MVKQVSQFLAACLLLSTPVFAQNEFNGAWPYEVPPNGHFNSFASGGMVLGPYQDLMEPALAFYNWAEGEYIGQVADTFAFEGNDFVVTLKDGLTWSDGTPLSAEDVVTTYNVAYLLGGTLAENITAVVADDELTARFTVTAPTLVIERSILTYNLRPDSVYHDFGMQAAELRTEGLAGGDETFDALLTELSEFRPETYVSVGPYILNTDSISDASVRLDKNEGGYNADVVAFDEITLWNGETETIIPLVADGQLWFTTHGLSPATEQSFIDEGIDILRFPMYTGPGLYMNYTVEPLNRPEVRQALAHAIDRDENGFVSLGDSGVSSEYMSGMSDALAEQNLSEDVLDSLDEYDYDPELAAQMLTDIGFTKGDDGIWVDDTGKRMAFTLTFPAEYADWSAAGENLAQQLNNFGFDITARGVQFQQHVQDVYDGNFEMAIRDWGSASPLPYFSYVVPYQTYNGGGLSAGEQGNGMSFDPNVTYSAGELNVLDTTITLGGVEDAAEQAGLLEQLAVSYNELLPAIPLWERYGNNTLNRNFLAAPADDDPIYLSGGNDHFMPYLIMTDGVTPADGQTAAK